MKAKQIIESIGMEKFCAETGLSEIEVQECLENPNKLNINVLERSYEAYGLILGDWK